MFQRQQNYVKFKDFLLSGSTNFAFNINENYNTIYCTFSLYNHSSSHLRILRYSRNKETLKKYAKV